MAPTASTATALNTSGLGTAGISNPAALPPATPSKSEPGQAEAPTSLPHAISFGLFASRPVVPRTTSLTVCGKQQQFRLPQAKQESCANTRERAISHNFHRHRDSLGTPPSPTPLRGRRIVSGRQVVPGERSRRLPQRHRSAVSVGRKSNWRATLPSMASK